MNRKTILIADDDSRLLKALSIRLESVGYRVVGAQDAIQAVSVARRDTPDLLILDINMPAGDGFTIQERIRSIAGLERVPVIYLTGDQSARVSGAAREKGACALLYKPVDTEQLLLAVSEAVGATESARTKALDQLQLAADQRRSTG